MQLLFDDGVEDLRPRRVQDPAAPAPEGRWGARAVILLGPRLPLGPRSGGSRDGGVRAGGLLVHFGFRVEEFLGRRQRGFSGALQGVDAGAAAGRGSLSQRWTNPMIIQGLGGLPMDGDAAWDEARRHGRAHWLREHWPPLGFGRLLHGTGTGSGSASLLGLWQLGTGTGLGDGAGLEAAGAAAAY